MTGMEIPCQSCKPAISNINFTIEKGNPHAVALRTHYAQHGFVSHSVINIGEGKAGIFDVGNEMENVKFLGGEYGIYTNRTSPGWPIAPCRSRAGGGDGDYSGSLDGRLWAIPCQILTWMPPYGWRS